MTKFCPCCNLDKELGLFDSPGSKTCMKCYARNYYLKNKEKLDAYNRKNYQDNREHYRELSKQYCKNNAVKARAKAKKWREDNPERYKKALKDNYEKTKEKRLKDSSEYKKKNAGRVTAWNKKRDLAKIQRTPPWLSEQQLKEIEQVYIESARLTKETGIVYNVDHIVPLQGKLVSGLHVPWNLQILTKKENGSKLNKFELKKVI